MGFKAFKGFLAVRLRPFFIAAVPLPGDGFKSMGDIGYRLLCSLLFAGVNTFSYLLLALSRFSLASDNEMSDTHQEQAFFFAKEAIAEAPVAGTIGMNKQNILPLSASL
jgi:hypothetical protein